MDYTRKTLCAALLLSTFAGCATKDTPVEIGAVLPLSGQWSIYGESIRKGVDLAYEHIQNDDSYPYKLSLQVEDSESNPALGAEKLSEMYDSGALFVIGGVTTFEALEMAPVAEDMDRVLMSPSASSAELTDATTRFYRVYPSDQHEGTRLGNYAFEKLGLPEVVMVVGDTRYAKGISAFFRAEIERLGGKVVEEITYPDDTQDFTSVADRVMEINPPAVYLADFGQNVRKILRLLRQLQYRGKVLTTSAFAVSDILEQAGKDAEGVFVPQIVFDTTDLDNLPVQIFLKEYRAKYNHEPDLYAAHGYDALMVLAEALKEGGGRTDLEFWKGLRGLSTYPGVTGPIQFDQNGDVEKFPRVFMITDGKFADYDKVLEKQKQEILERLKELERRSREALRRGNNGG